MMNLSDPIRARDELTRALSSGSADTIARTAAANLWPLYNAHSEMLITAISALPSTVLERHPMLRVLHPMTPVLARTTRAFRPIVHTDDARTLGPEEVDFLLLAQMMAFRFCGDVTAALVYARRLEERILHTRIEARDRMDGPLWFFHQQIGSTLLAAGDSGGALLQLATARQLGQFSRQPDAERMALGRTALAHAVRGTLGDAERALAEARQLPPPTTAHASSTRSTEAAAAALIGVDRMSENLDDLLAALEPYDSTELSWPFALLARSRAFLARQQPEEALEAIHLAADAHPPQHGSFAADVISATSIKVLLCTGDIDGARRFAEGAPDAGVLTRLAAVRVRLHDGLFDAAARELRLLAADPSLGPAQRAESVLFSGWIELGRNGELDRDTAMQICRTACRRDRRRLLAIMPRQLVEEVRELLPGESAAEFDGVTAGLSSLDMQARPSLTHGELRILNALPARHSTAMMAAVFHVSPNTVKSQLRSLYRKLGCSSRDDAIRIGTRLHLLAS